MLTKSAQKKSWEATLARVKNEMAIPPMAKSARHALSRQKWGNNQPMRSNKEDPPPRISFNFAGLVTLNERFATGESIFSEGDTAETLMYIQSGRVKLSVASEAGKVAIVAILGPGEFLGEACLGSQNNIRIRTATAIAPTALLVIKRNEMIRALRTDRALSYAFLSYLILSNIRIEEDFVESVAFIKYIAVSNANGGIDTDSYRLD
jgi:Cyclic nucleotide-binding domain